MKKKPVKKKMKSVSVMIRASCAIKFRLNAASIPPTINAFLLNSLEINPITTQVTAPKMAWPIKGQINEFPKRAKNKARYNGYSGRRSVSG